VAEQEPLADGGPGGDGFAGVLDGLDALGDHHRVGPFRLGADGVDDVGRLGRGPALEQAQVQLDDVGADEREHGQAGPGSALTNRVRGGPSPQRTASVKAAARQAQSSSATRPAR
jgi:hypothetical protein